MKAARVLLILWIVFSLPAVVLKHDFWHIGSFVSSLLLVVALTIELRARRRPHPKAHSPS